MSIADANYLTPDPDGGEFTDALLEIMDGVRRPGARLRLGLGAVGDRTDDLIGRLLKNDTEDEWRMVHIPAQADPKVLDPDPLGREPGEFIEGGQSLRVLEIQGHGYLLVHQRYLRYHATGSVSV